MVRGRPPALTPDLALAMRRALEQSSDPQPVIAAAFGVSVATVAKVAAGRYVGLPEDLPPLQSRRICRRPPSPSAALTRAARDVGLGGLLAGAATTVQRAYAVAALLRMGLLGNPSLADCRRVMAACADAIEDRTDLPDHRALLSPARP